MIPITLTDYHIYLMGCKCDHLLLTSGGKVVDMLKELVERSGLEPLESKFHDFNEGGTTAVVLLAESHVAVHTWPETNHLVVVDISVCNYTADNRKKTRMLKDMVVKAFKPSDQVVHEVDPTPRSQEYTCPGMAYFAEIDQYIEQRKTAFQELLLFQNRAMGKVLVLDGLFQTSEKDEFIYHEAIIHPAMLTHKDPRSVLILGGGDMGAAEEVLKYPQVERVLQVELDQEVVEVCKEQLGSIHRDCYKDKRYEIRFEDGFDFMMREGERFDVLVMDLSDPVGTCERLYTGDFYASIHNNRMSEGAILSLHEGFPFTIPERSRRINASLKQTFPVVRNFMNFVPLYGNPLLYALCGDRVDLLSVEEADRKIMEYGLKDLNYVCGESYRALFGVPLYIRRLLEAG